MTTIEKKILAKLSQGELATTEFTKNEMKAVWAMVASGVLKEREGELELCNYTKTYSWGRGKSIHTVSLKRVYISVK